ncbi:MAG: SsrA-binding protein [Verrucomicrobiales bacterium]|jgi:SsrA-binding protein
MGAKKDIATNRKALRDYEILERFEAGVELLGTEVKSIRDGKININDAYARVENSQVFLYSCDIQPYVRASHSQHEARRTRRLLLHKKEINQLFGHTQLKGLTIVCLRAYWVGQRVKLEIGVGKGKAHRDQRQDIKKREAKRDAERAMASFNQRR